MVDANGKEIPWVDKDGRVVKTYEDRLRPAPGQKFIGERTNWHTLIPDLGERIQKGEYKLPLYADLPGLPDVERRRIWGLMVGNEGKTPVAIIRTYTEAGYDSSRDMLQSYMGMGEGMMIVGMTGRDIREVGKERVAMRPAKIGGQGLRVASYAGGIVPDWDLKTTLDGLYAAGDGLFAGNYHHHAAATGRYAGRKAAEYAMKAAAPVVARKQVEAEKARVYAPIKRSRGMDWKEMNAGTAQIMQNYCGDLRAENLLNIGLLWLKDVEENFVPNLYAPNPHVLGRTIDVMDILTVCQIIMHASLARKASSQFLDFHRIDYPEVDPPAWRKFITLRLEDGDVKTGELPIDYGFPLSKNYEAHNKDYQGWYDKQGKYLTGQAKK
jgi:succinate dehydrogenase/fumarate reductase flavoprotein subunit